MSNSNWKYSSITVCGNLMHRKPVPFDGTKPYVATADVNGFEVKPSEEFTYRERPSRADVAVEKGELLQAKMMGTNKAVYVDNQMKDWLFSTGFALFAPEKVGNSSAYFYQYLQSDEYLHSRDLLSVGTTQQAISNHDLSRIMVKYPKDQILQEKIGEILSNSDKTIRYTNELIEKYQKIKTGLMNDLFTRGVTEDGKLRPSREDAPELYKETEVGWIPNKWDIKTWGAVTNTWAMGPRFSAEEYNEFGNVATLRTTDLDDIGTIEYSTMPIAKLNINSFRSHILQQNDFLISRSGTCGIAAIFDTFHLPVLPGAFLIRYRFNDMISGKYMQYFVNSDIGKLKVLKYAEGGVQKNLRGTSLCKIKLSFPNRNEQDKIVERIEQIDKVINSEKNNYSKLMQQKKGLMNDLLKGIKQVNLDKEESNNV